MSRLEIASPKKAKIVMEGLYKDLERRIESSPPGLCPVDMARAFLELCHAQTCGKCVPCREGTKRMLEILERIVAGNGKLEDLDLPIKIAVMGCAVNGPGEAREADIGIAGGDGCAILFRKGEILRKIPEDQVVEELAKEVEQLALHKEG